MRSLSVLLASIGCALVILEPAHVAMERREERSAPAAAPDVDAIVRVTAIVTDRRGQPLAGLAPADFELLVDGKPQPLDTAELTKGAVAPRAFAFLLDEFHTSAGDSAAVRDGLLQFVDRALRPADLAVVVKPLDPLTEIRPTTDRSAVRDAIATFAGRKGDYSPRTVFERNYMAQAPAAVAWARGQIVTSALRAIGATLSNTPNVKPAIVLVSDGFERMRASREVPANLQSAVRIANRADAPVYAFAPALAPPAGDTGGADPGLEALRALAADTGGEVVAGAGELANGLARMERDLATHYVLTYRPAHGSDGKFHALQVAVKRPDVQVRARTGYLAPMSAAMRAAATRAPSAPVRVLRRSALIQSWSGVLPGDGGRSAVTLTWEPSPLLAATPARRRPETIVITASAADGTVLFDGGVRSAGAPALPDVPNRATFAAPAGPVRIDIKILDPKGVVLDTDARDVTVTAPRTDRPTIYAPAVMRTRSAREFRDALDLGSVPPIPTRDFRRTDRLLIAVPAFDATGAPAPVTGVLMNRWRQPMRGIAALDGAGAPAGVTRFDLPLAPLPPGEYTLQLTVAHARGTVSEHVTFRVGG